MPFMIIPIRNYCTFHDDSNVDDDDNGNRLFATPYNFCGIPQLPTNWYVQHSLGVSVDASSVHNRCVTFWRLYAIQTQTYTQIVHSSNNSSGSTCGEYECPHVCCGSGSDDERCRNRETNRQTHTNTKTTTIIRTTPEQIVCDPPASGVCRAAHPRSSNM